MPAYARKLALEFNQSAPIPHAPHDSTVYGPASDSMNPVAFLDDDVRPPLLPGWSDALPGYSGWLKAFFQTGLGRAFHANFLALKSSLRSANDNTVNLLRNKQLEALYENAQNSETHGYRIYDPFSPLRNLSSPETQAFIDAENERTQKFVAGTPAREKAAAFLREQWADRKAEPFTVDADSEGCVGYRHRRDPWTYPSDREIAKKHRRSGGKAFGVSGNHVLAEQYVRGDSEIITYPVGDPAQARTLISGSPGNRMRGAFMHNGLLLVSFYHNCADELKIYTPAGEHLADVPLPVGKLKAVSVDEATGKLRLTLTSLLHPEGDWLYDAEKNTLAPVDGKPGPLEGCIVEQIWARGSFQDRIPMFVVRRPDVALDGSAALKLSAYGAAWIPVNPAFNAEIAQWVAAGGIYAMANIHGGSELGEEWAKSGMGMNRKNVIFDVAACARELCARKYSSPGRTVFQGRSNGGWLAISSALAGDFDFGAVVSDVPIGDLFDLENGGGSYPDKDSRAGLAELLKLSPYHNIKPGARHAPLLITAGDSDTIANTWQALKMTAAQQENDAADGLCLLRVRRGSGHLPTFVPNDEMVAERADVFSFIERNIGPIDQNEYKASLYYEEPPAPRSLASADWFFGPG